MKRVLLRAFAVLVVLVLGSAAAVAFWVRGVYESPYKGYGGDEQFVEIPSGSSVAAVARHLAQAGIVHDPWLFRLAVWRRQADHSVQAGEYRFDKALTVEEVLLRLVKGDVYLRPLTIREGLTIREMAEVFEQRGFGAAADFVAAAADASLVRDIDPSAPDLEGYLFPETYALSRQSTARDLVHHMAERFTTVFTADMIRRARERGLTPRQVVTVASLVEKETALADERPRVAAVYLERLKREMLLQCDPTVIYALRRDGRFDGNLTRADLAYDSPYNTYRYPGLPPGPIAAPGRASLEAVLAPAADTSLYFVSRNDGSHAFARTLEEHNRNVLEFQVRYFRERRAREQREGPQRGARSIGRP
ncbi:MAG: endolytic transglycosylase MltG [Vicinamibacterales bacterium]